MHTSVRPYLTTGIALAGATVVAVTPIAPPPHDVQTPNPMVQLVANPLGLDTQLFDQALADLTGLFESQDLPDVLDGPLAALLDDFLNDPEASFEDFVAAFEEIVGGIQGSAEALPALLQGVFDDVTAGDVEGAVNSLIFAVVATLLPVATALVVPVAAILLPGVPPAALEPLVTVTLLGLAGPLISGPGATGTALQDVIDALGEGDPAEVLGALIGAPGTILDGVVNGGYGPNLAPLVVGAFPLPPALGLNVLAGGLINPLQTAIVPDPLPPNPPLAIVNVTLPGTLTTLQTISALLLAALNPPEALSVTSIPGADRVVTVNTVDDTAAAAVQDAGTAGAVAVQQTPARGGGADETEDSGQATVVEGVEANTSGTDLSDGNKVVPGGTGSSNSSGQRGSGLTAIRDGFTSTVKGFGDAVRSVTGLGGGGDAASGVSGSGSGSGEGSEPGN